MTGAIGFKEGKFEGLESLVNLIKSEVAEPQLNEDIDDIDDLVESKEKSYPKKITPQSNNQILKIQAPFLNPCTGDFNVSSFFDFQKSFKEDYFVKLSNTIQNTKKFRSNNNIPFEKNFFINHRMDKALFTPKDTVYYKSKKMKMTNSVVFFLNHYYKKEEYYKFNTKITSQPITVSNLLLIHYYYNYLVRETKQSMRVLL